MEVDVAVAVAVAVAYFLVTTTEVGLHPRMSVVVCGCSTKEKKP